MHKKEESNRLEDHLIACKSFQERDDMYEIVDFLNKNLKEYNLLFGLKKEDKDKMIIRIYEV